MKGLLIKDFYTLTKQLKMFLVIIVLFSFMQGASTYSFAIIYSAMLPITALAYDERSKWDRLAGMMPYPSKSLVLGKYLLGYICIIAAAILSLIVKVIFSFSSKAPLSTETIAEMIMIVCFATLFEAINLPFMYKLGVEKGRLIFLALIAIIVIGGVALQESIIQWADFLQIDFLAFFVVFLIITVILNIISIALSIRIYKNKEN